MQITLYKNTSSPETVNKNITRVVSPFACSLKDDTDIAHPVILISKSKVSDVTSFNYCYLDLFKRYYYLELPKEKLGGMLEIQGKVDVLMSHKDAIKNLNAMVERQQNFYNLYLPDLRIPDKAYKRVQTLKFPMQPLETDGILYLAVSGRG